MTLLPGRFYREHQSSQSTYSSADDVACVAAVEDVASVSIADDVDLVIVENGGAPVSVADENPP
jgi:hypothetical protein